MRIAIVIDIYQDKGNGTSMSARHFVQKLRERGNEITILCTKGPDSDKEDGVNIIEFPALKVPIFQRIIESQHAI